MLCTLVSEAHVFGYKTSKDDTYSRLCLRWNSIDVNIEPEHGIKINTHIVQASRRRQIPKASACPSNRKEGLWSVYRPGVIEIIDVTPSPTSWLSRCLYPALGAERPVTAAISGGTLLSWRLLLIDSLQGISKRSIYIYIYIYIYNIYTYIIYIYIYIYIYYIIHIYMIYIYIIYYIYIYNSAEDARCLPAPCVLPSASDAK